MKVDFYSISNEVSIYRKRTVNTYMRRVFLTYTYGLDLYSVECELVVGFRTWHEYGYSLGVL